MGDTDTTRLRPLGGVPERAPDATTVLRRPLPPEGAAAASAAHTAPQPPPAAPAEGRPPAGFDSFFRPDTGPSDATRHLPPQATGAAGPYGGGAAGASAAGLQGTPLGPRRGRGGARRAAARRGLPRAALAGALVASCAVVGLFTGAALTDDEGDQDGTGAPGDGASAPTEDAAAGSAEAQAKELDALLADSNNSRSAVIRSVDDIRRCERLGEAAENLRQAARQRDGLVSRLRGLELGELSRHRELTDALTRAWRASAEADEHYARWADQLAVGREGCRGGEARPTRHSAAGNRASSEATAAKKEAAGLWNPTAEKYGLPERRFDQL